MEYLSSNANIAFPFHEDAPGLLRDGTGFPLDIVVDAIFEVPAYCD